MLNAEPTYERWAGAHLTTPASLRETVVHRRASISRMALSVVLVLQASGVWLLGFGCAQPRRTFAPAVDPARMGDVAFTHYLAQTPIVSVDEGQRAVLMLVGSSREWPTYEQRREELLDRKAIKPRWKLEADHRLDFGTLAYMLRTICDAPKGLNDVLSGWTGIGERRAALRTCVYHELLPHRRANEPVTGGELLSAMTAAEACLARHGASDRPSP